MYEIEEQSRTSLLLGEEAMDKIRNSKVIVFGVGGVGGYVVEALARCGIGTIDIVDKDIVSVSNINRQIIALHSTIGMNKVDVMKHRINDINPTIKVNAHNCFYLPDNSSDFNFAEYDYVVDAVDTVTAKLHIIENAKKSNVPVISSMGAGNKIKPSMFKVADIYDTKICPLAKVMRKELKKRSIDKLKVVYSEEEPIKVATGIENEQGRRSTPGSVSFVPSVVGLIIAGEVINDLIK